MFQADRFNPFLRVSKNSLLGAKCFTFIMEWVYVPFFGRGDDSAQLLGSYWFLVLTKSK